MVSVITNPEALRATQAFGLAQSSQAGVQNRVSTGLKVTGAREDASNFSIAQGIRTDVRAWEAVHKGLGTGLGSIKVAVAAAESISNLIAELKKKVVEYHATDSARQPIVEADIDEVLDQIDLMAEQATFNGNNLINRDQASLTYTPPADEGTTFTFNGAGSNTHAMPTVSGTVTLSFTATGSGGGPLRLIYNGVTQDSEAISPPETGTLNFAYPATPTTDFTVQKAGSPNTDIDYVFFFTPDSTNTEGEFKVLEDTDGGAIDVQYRSMLADDLGLRPPVLTNVTASLAQISAAEIEVNQNLGYYGAKARSFELARERSERMIDSHEVGLGNIVDANMAREAAELTSAQIRTNLSRDALGLVTQAQRVVLNLFT